MTEKENSPLTKSLDNADDKHKNKTTKELLQMNVKDIISRVPFEPISLQQKKYLDDHPITLQNNTSNFNTLQSKDLHKARAKTHSRQYSSGLSKFLEENRFSREKSMIPGPGSYDTSILRKTIKGGAFFKGPQYRSVERINPGPGSYETIKSVFGRKGYSIARSSKKIEYYDTQNPGPASYQIPELSRFKSKTARVIFPKAKIYTEAPETPGPGSYNSNPSTLTRRSALIKGRARFSIKKVIAPGPVDYHPNYQAASHRRQSAFFPKSKTKVV